MIKHFKIGGVYVICDTSLEKGKSIAKKDGMRTIMFMHPIDAGEAYLISGGTYSEVFNVIGVNEYSATVCIKWASAKIKEKINKL